MFSFSAIQRLNPTLKNKFSIFYKSVSNITQLVCSDLHRPSGCLYRQVHIMSTLVNSMSAKFKRLPQNVIKSQNDCKDYRVIKLQNGLTALLISDKDGATNAVVKSDCQVEEKKGEKLAAAALCVGIGSFSDPGDIPGLAHFLEHMVFMGSEKYPNENEFDEFVRKHGGENNAFTECEYTVFYFSIEKNAFQQGLDIFSGFFSKPLMKKDSVDREIKAVDSEFCMSKPSDSVRYDQILATMAKDGHPMGKFMWGNIESLKEGPGKNGIDLYTNLQQFYSSGYSAEYMTLVVQALYPLDTLEEWVVDIFSSIPNNSHERPTFYHLSWPFDMVKYNKIYKMVPCKNENKLIISWSLPTLVNEYQSKPLSYLGFLVGHEGKGSIMSYLRKRMWAVDLEGGNNESGFEHNMTHSAFNISIKLTETGFEHVYEVMTVVLQYMDMLRRKGPQKWIFDELKQIQDNEFRWIEDEDAIDNAENLSSNMLKYSVEEYITGEKLYTKYDPQSIANCLEQLVPHKANFFISSKIFAKQNICHLRESWYKTEYCIEEVPEELKDKWKELDANPELDLPAPNPYIASDFNLKPAVNPTMYPVAVTDTEQGKLFYKQDTKFKTPKAYVSFLLLSPAIKKSAESLCMLDIFLDVLNHQLTETAYAASVASLSYNIKRIEHGLLVKVVGFNHKLLKLFETIIDFIADFSVDHQLLEMMKKKVQKDYYNAMIKPSKLNRQLRLSILRLNEKTSIDGMRTISDVTVDSMLSFVAQMTSVVFIEGLIQGNLTAEEAKVYESYVLKRLNCKPIPERNIPENRVVQLPLGERYCRTENLNKNDENSFITNYYQYGQANLHQYALNDLLIMRMEEPCFDVLRTQHQLGYIVYCTNHVTDGILGFSVTVCSQADNFSLEKLDTYMEEFLNQFNSMLQADMEQDFETLRSSLITVKNCVDSNLGEEFSRNWAEIVDKTYCFDTLSKQVI
ncbi:hypothetical protein LSH36_740g00013 [Paralvinella palmiformis]|uniref:Nardilysin n=1 Tax=Paralvinella palmiformis TaxID=53620 RepID=A0AAD9MUT7_9ANNE|nr:hypothetical protein LSH36_740g00013 [Paralvinella palmiformis]